MTPSTAQQLTSKYTSPDPTPPTSHWTPLLHTHTCAHNSSTQTRAHVPGAHLLSKSRKKCGQFSKSLPRTLMRFPMAGDLDGRKQQNAYSTQNLATRTKMHDMHMENTAGCDCFRFLPICTCLIIRSSSPPPLFCLSNMSRAKSDILVINKADHSLHPIHSVCWIRLEVVLNPVVNHLAHSLGVTIAEQWF